MGPRATPPPSTSSEKYPDSSWHEKACDANSALWTLSLRGHCSTTSTNLEDSHLFCSASLSFLADPTNPKLCGSSLVNTPLACLWPKRCWKCCRSRILSGLSVWPMKTSPSNSNFSLLYLPGYSTFTLTIKSSVTKKVQVTPLQNRQGVGSGDEMGPCRTCFRFKLERLGFQAKRPDWE